jgi:hypothetical protein
LIGELSMTMIRSSGWLGVLKEVRKGAINGRPRVSPMMLAATPISPAARLPRGHRLQDRGKVVETCQLGDEPFFFEKIDLTDDDATTGFMGIDPITIFSGICAEADNPRLLADTDTVTNIAALFPIVWSAWRRVSSQDFIDLPPGTVICSHLSTYCGVEGPVWHPIALAIRMRRTCLLRAAGSSRRPRTIFANCSGLGP